MKKILGILAMAAMVGSPAWAWEDYTLKIDNNGAAFVYKNSTDRIGNGEYELARIRPDGRDRLWNQRLKELDRRLAQQRDRIRDGRERGDLTRQEAVRLEADQRQIRSVFYSAIGDGRLSSKEWRSLSIMLDQASDNIYRLRHNRRYAKNDVPVKSPENRWKFNRRFFR